MRLLKYAGAALVNGGEIPGVPFRWTVVGDHAVSEHISPSLVGAPDENGLFPEGTAQHLVSIGFAQFEE